MYILSNVYFYVQMYITYPNNFHISPEMNHHFDDVKLPPFINRDCNQCFFGPNFAKMQTKKIAMTSTKQFFFKWYFHPLDLFFKKCC
jgi:hypothetical protein